MFSVTCLSLPRTWILPRFSSVPGYAYQPHRLAAYSLGVPRAVCQHAESILARSREDESLPLVRSHGDESPPLTRSSRGQFVFPAPFQAGQLCSVEGFSETARTQGGRFSGMSSGIITHAPAAAMAEISSPMDGVDFGMFAHRGHIEALTQPRSLQPGSSPVLSSVARDGHDGCIDSRLGSSVRGNASFGTVAGISEPVAHKPPGAGSSLLSSKGFSATAGTAACTDSHRQHVCGFVYKSPERNSLKGAVQAGNGLSSSSSELRTSPVS